MSVKFLTAINRVLGHEGGYTDGKGDPGGETNWGISKRSYPGVSIATLTRNQAIAIYYRDFWLAAHCEDLSDGAGFQLVDCAVNSGIGQSVRLMQRALGVADDGHYGPVTLAAMRKISEVHFVMLFLAERLDFMTRLKNWDAASRGWSRRIAANIRYGVTDT